MGKGACAGPSAAHAPLGPPPSFSALPDPPGSPSFGQKGVFGRLGGPFQPRGSRTRPEAALKKGPCEAGRVYCALDPTSVSQRAGQLEIPPCNHRVFSPSPGPNFFNSKGMDKIKGHTPTFLGVRREKRKGRKVQLFTPQLFTKTRNKHMERTRIAHARST